MTPYYEHAGITIYHGDCREVMPTLDLVHAIICDPPYELGFMGKAWDKTGIANDVKMWTECLRVLRPGGHLLSFGGSRTYHRMACAIEDAGFEIRDQIMWLYGSGFPKSLDVSKAIDKAAGAEREVVETRRVKGGGTEHINRENLAQDFRPGDYQKGENILDVTAPATDAAKQWEGWGTALKPAHEPICVARKPIEGTVAANVLKHGTGALNIDGCRIEGTPEPTRFDPSKHNHEGWRMTHTGEETASNASPLGRWPANIILDGSDEVVSLFPQTSSGELRPYSENHQNATSFQMHRDKTFIQDANSGSSARFFYTAKASQDERGIGNNHPTVKPLELMAYLCKLLCPPSGGVLLDPFMGSGSTIIAGRRFYQHCIGIELEEKYAEIAAKRLSQEVFDFGGAE